MKSKFTSFIMTIIMPLIIVILIVFGIIIYQEIMHGDADVQVENFVSSYIEPFNDVEEEKITTPEIIDNSNREPIESTPTNKDEETNYDEVQIDKYFYNQLEPEAKTIYQAFEANKEQMKTGTAQIDLGTTFSELLATEDGEKKLGEYYQSAVETYLYDNPDVFYITASKLYLNIETTTRGTRKTYDVFINNGNEQNYFLDGYSSEAQVKQAINEVESIKNQIISQKTGNTYNDVKMVHDYLINTIEYETTISKNNIYNIYGALVQNESVCEGYAKAFKYLLDELQIPCVMVIGQATNSKGETENHAWNYVQINGNWYAVDTTWDDPVIIGNGIIGNDVKYKYFLKGQNEFYKDHTPRFQFTDNGRQYTYPQLSVYDYR